MNDNHSTLLSKKGMKELKKAIAKLEHQQQQAITEMREQDKVDNHEQRLARIERFARLEMIETELADKQQILKNSKLFPRKRDALKVALGSVVELIDTQGKVFHYMIVDSIEANPSDGRISASSPLGQTLLGKTIKETINWRGFRGSQLQLVSIK